MREKGHARCRFYFGFSLGFSLGTVMCERKDMLVADFTHERDVHSKQPVHRVALHLDLYQAVRLALRV